MSSTSPNFGLTIATQNDIVNVDSHVAGPLSTLDSLLGQAHTGTGQLKTGLAMSSPTLINPVLSGTMTGGTIVATTGNFQVLMATAGTLTVNAFNIGTYNIVGTIGNTNEVLSVVTGNAVWRVITNTGTGADIDLSNLASVSINTSLNTFTAGFITANRVIATSGALTGLTAFQATTGTFAGNLSVTGTVTANVINATGGTITAGGFSIGTYSYPATVGSTGQILRVTTGNLVFASVQSGAGTILVKATSFSNLGLATHFNVTITASKIYEVFITISGSNFDPHLVFNDDTGASSYLMLGTTTGARIPLTATDIDEASYLKTRFTIDTFPAGTGTFRTRALVMGESMCVAESTSLIRENVNGIYTVSGATITGFGIVTVESSMNGTLVVWELSQTT